MSVPRAYGLHKGVPVSHTLLLLLVVGGTAVAHARGRPFTPRLAAVVLAMAAVTVAGGGLLWAASPRRHPPAARRAIWGHCLANAVTIVVFVAVHGAVAVGSFTLFVYGARRPDAWAPTVRWVALASALATLASAAVTGVQAADARKLVLAGGGGVAAAAGGVERPMVVPAGANGKATVGEDGVGEGEGEHLFVHEI